MGERSFRSGSKDPIIPYSIVVRLFVFQKREGKGEKKIETIWNRFQPIGRGRRRSTRRGDNRGKDLAERNSFAIDNENRAEPQKKRKKRKKKKKKKKKRRKMEGRDERGRVVRSPGSNVCRFSVKSLCGLKHDRPESVPSYVSIKQLAATRSCGCVRVRLLDVARRCVCSTVLGLVS